MQVISFARFYILYLKTLYVAWFPCLSNDVKLLNYVTYKEKGSIGQACFLGVTYKFFIYV